ncbi:hypothetical protein ACFVVJ_16775 [Streptomyces albidoflavus]
MDHTQLPILVLPPKGKALAPWLTTVVGDSTRALLGWRHRHRTTSRRNHRHQLSERTAILISPDIFANNAA